MTLKTSLRRVRLLLTDVDGVLTDGRLFYVERAKGVVEETKGFHSQDGLGLILAHEAGLKTGIISARTSAGVVHRAKILKMTYIIQGTFAKAEAYEKIKADGYADDEIAYVGDDLPDLPVMLRCGLPVAVANARPEVKAAARLVTRRAGGDGALRELVEMILKAQGRWPAIVARFKGTR